MEPDSLPNAVTLLRHNNRHYQAAITTIRLNHHCLHHRRIPSPLPLAQLKKILVRQELNLTSVTKTYAIILNLKKSSLSPVYLLV
ncbi:hypothetical protein L1887_37363 [Cichorium endivia]|nr:hypothetical protein L1887_37363 [Cichorium endivia]